MIKKRISKTRFWPTIHEVHFGTDEAKNSIRSLRFSYLSIMSFYLLFSILEIQDRIKLLKLISQNIKQTCYHLFK